MDRRPAVESSVKQRFAEALADPTLSEADIARLSPELRPFGRIDPEAVVIPELLHDAPVSPHCGGRANKGYVEDRWWLGTRDMLILVGRGGGVGQGWWWSVLTDVKQGRRLGRFGSVRVTFDNGYKLRLRVRTYDSDMILAMWHRYRDTVHGEGRGVIVFLNR